MELFTIHDYSYSLISSPVGMMETYTRLMEGNKYRILAENCNLPAARDDHNDTVIQDIKSAEIVFIQRRFLRPIRTFCSECGTRL